MKVRLKIIDALFLGLILYHLLISPYTKVEESFNLQAIHDLLNYGLTDHSKFDHKAFPGAVKRSFTGSLIIYMILNPLRTIIDRGFQLLPESFFIYKMTQMKYQLSARILLGLFNWLAFLDLKYSVKRTSLKNRRQEVQRTEFWFSLVQFTQFHIPYYASRTLPNFMALPIVNFGLAQIIKGKVLMGISLLLATGIVMRVEILAFSAIIYLIALAQNQITFRRSITALFLVSFCASFTTILVDSYFWEEWSFPEFESFVFNVLHGNASNWGMEPLHAYFTKYLRKIYLLPLVPIIACVEAVSKSNESRSQKIHLVSLSSIAFVLMMSMQKHKEWRFIVYAIPGINLSAAQFLAGIKVTKLYQWLIVIAVYLTSMLSLIASLFFGYVSSFNYPGGVAMQLLNQHILTDTTVLSNNTTVRVHFDPTSCMSGVSLFGELELENVYYDKTETLENLIDRNFWTSFDYVITHCDNEKQFDCRREKSNDHGIWSEIEAVSEFDGVDLHKVIKDLPRTLFFAWKHISIRQTAQPVLQTMRTYVKTKPCLYLFKRSMPG
ncbi:hypothetical protein OGAPHI_007060 [Ogataea philodendri]|uniref:Mannosyltransferase n=1 Tax=Ogataea philodendri TaxID=1378263 RepID=A0A9P8NW15_9ASCO|nr:uncharacterized protein OGAPHI_007060 [Ogataea philodendri]KAH3660474.1 hypothetical protein OGAPHI_007060 [Ogataea philodendri]